MKPGFRFVCLIGIVLATSATWVTAQLATFKEEVEVSPIATDKATVYVFRQKQFGASGSDLAIQLDGEIQGWLRGGEYVRFDLAPGQHIVSATLVRKGEDTNSWYAEFWPPLATAFPSPEKGLSPWEQALLSLPPDVALTQPYFAEDYKRVAGTAFAEAVMKKASHQGVLTRGSDHWVWAEGRSRVELERRLDEAFASIGKSRDHFWARVPPSRFKRSRRTDILRVVAEPGQSYFLYLRFLKRRPWTSISLQESLAEFGDSVPASNEKYGSEWRVGEKFLKNRK